MKVKVSVVERVHYSGEVEIPDDTDALDLDDAAYEAFVDLTGQQRDAIVCCVRDRDVVVVDP